MFPLILAIFGQIHIWKLVRCEWFAIWLQPGYIHTYIHTYIWLYIYKCMCMYIYIYRIYPVTYRIYTYIYNIHIHSWFFMWGWLDLQTWKCWPLRMGTYIRRKKVPCGLRGGSYFKSEWINILLEQTSWSAIRRVIHRKPVRSLRGEGCSS